MHAIVLPVKSLDEAKARLDPALSPVERAALTLAMLEDVLDATLAMPGWETWVLSPDETVLEVVVNVANAHEVESLLRGILFRLRFHRHEQGDSDAQLGRKYQPSEQVTSAYAL